MTAPQMSILIACRLAGQPGAVMRAAFLRLCLTALDQQTEDSGAFEVLIVDDASETPVDQLLGELIDSGLTLRPKLVRNDGPPMGITGAHNLAARHASGEWLFLCTDDSLLAPDCLQRHLHAQRESTRPTYFCGTEYLYVPSILFSDLIAGDLHPRGDLSVRLLGRLFGVDDLRATAEQLGFTQWNVTEEDIRHNYDRVLARSAVTPPFRDIYQELDSGREDLRWLCVRVGNHSLPRSAFDRVGGMTETLPGINSDQDLGLKMQAAGIEIARLRHARSVLLEHWRNIRSFNDSTGLAQLAEHWPRPEVQNLSEYFGAGFERSIAGYRRSLTRFTPGQR